MEALTTGQRDQQRERLPEEILVSVFSQKDLLEA